MPMPWPQPCPLKTKVAAASAVAVPAAAASESAETDAARRRGIGRRARRLKVAELGMACGFATYACFHPRRVTSAPMAVREDVLPDRYRNPERIARGGMGDVYRAVDSVLGRTVAVKVLNERYA